MLLGNLRGLLYLATFGLPQHIRSATLTNSMGDSLFMKIIRREIPSDIVHEDDKSITIRDVNPQAPVHLLVIPKKLIKGISSAEDCDTELLGHLMTNVRKVAVMEGLADGYRVVINDGRIGGQEVPHLHIHVLGKRQMKWPPG